MLIPPTLIQAIKTDPVEGTIAACEYVESQISDAGDWTDEEHNILLEMFALISSLEEASLIQLAITSPNATGDMRQVCLELRGYLNTVQQILKGQASKNRLQHLKNHFTLTVANGFGYEFSEGDLRRIQTLINELRDLVATGQDLADEHRQRLLKRLEDMQKELHKKTSDLSRYYGLLGDAGVAIGKFGEDAKPIVDRIKEILQITWNTQARAEELPSGTMPPLLEKDD
ncbi:hypothetical protein PQS90_05025 [Pseudomonas sp. BLCC-B13]|uniref:hypothetical protein n=1 Tax=Pseudomonas sp. BLCC-B13 TaxID=3025314 RepID=UPI00234EBEEE|nr:hypothetical protein [Pseudomonas sp. BLCC-B13]MDC7824509.1 hypothetical protein [Pseudomonas sp. BLCC-B13]